MKRCFDIVFAIVTLFVTSPILLLLMIAIPIESPGWPIFTQMRVGRGGKMFRIYKLRSMHRGEMPLELSRDPARLREHNQDRVTRIGKLVRKSGIDEVPQMINVLVGDMSIVGPRPWPESQVTPARYSPIRDDLRPGLTGLAVVSVLSGCRRELDKKIRHKIQKHRPVLTI